MNGCLKRNRKGNETKENQNRKTSKMKKEGRKKHGCTKIL